MTQLAVTGSNAFSNWSNNPTSDLTGYLMERGMPAGNAEIVNQQIMSDFNAARKAVRNPRAGMDWDSLRQGMRNNGWIAVSGEDDPPDYPVNVPIAPYPQFHQPITVAAPAAPWENRPTTNIDLTIRYFLASNRDPGAAQAPSIPPGDEVILYIHGEGSRAEEACDVIPKILSSGADVGRSFTVIALDLPGSGYTVRVRDDGVHETPRHLEIAQMPPTHDPSGTGLLDNSAFAGSPILDFVESAIEAFVEALVLPFGNRIAAVAGGSLGGHMALRIAASQRAWVGNVIAWSPASVMDHSFSILGQSIPARLLADPNLASRATTPEASADSAGSGSRNEFFATVWDQNTFSPPNAAMAATLAGGLAVLFSPLLGLGVVGALESLPSLPPQPQLWYRDDWPSKPVYIQESRWERQEVYNTNFRQWHWRICEEMIGFTFDDLAPRINGPLQLMVGEQDNYPYVHFLLNVKNFAASLQGLGRALTLQDTGHSIHNERPFFLANQIVNFPVI
jgi:pimeloyl-ACP methyl ester carboxylesterase